MRGQRDVGISVSGHSGLEDQVLVGAAFFSGRERPIDASQRRYPSVTVPAGPWTARTILVHFTSARSSSLLLALFFISSAYSLSGI